MREVGADEAETSLSQMLDWVEAGEEVVITRNGKPLARLVPPSSMTDADRTRAQEAAAAIRSMSRGASLGGLSIKDLINEGRR